MRILFNLELLDLLKLLCAVEAIDRIDQLLTTSVIEFYPLLTFGVKFQSSGGTPKNMFVILTQSFA